MVYAFISSSSHPIVVILYVRYFVLSLLLFMLYLVLRYSYSCLEFGIYGLGITLTMYILTNCIVFSKLTFTVFLLDQFLYLYLYVYKLCQFVAYVLAVTPMIWVSWSVIIYRKLLLSHLILYKNKLILIILIYIQDTKRSALIEVYQRNKSHI